MKIDQLGRWDPVAMLIMKSEPHTDAHVTNRLRSSRTISGSPLGASCGRSCIRSSRRADRSPVGRLPGSGSRAAEGSGRPALPRAGLGRRG